MRAFEDMLCQAFGVQSMPHLTACIRTYGPQISGQRTLVYIRHLPVDSPSVFHPQSLKTYLSWWDKNFVPLLPENANALLGISYEISKPAAFLKLLTEKECLPDIELSSATVFELLDELDKVTKRDIRKFINTHSIKIPKEIQDKVLDEILDKTQGSYTRIIEELHELENRAWREFDKHAVEQATNGADAYEDVF